MKRFALVLALALSLSIAAGSADAARRLGGGSSIGRQSSNVTQRSAQPAAPAQQQQQAAPASPAPVTPPVAPRRPWGAMLGGLAAGLGLAWLAHSLGLGEAFGNVLLFGLVIMAGMALIGYMARQRRPAAQGAGGALMPAADQAIEPRQYSPDKVGNDASARPWERSSMAFDAAKAAQGAGQASQIGSALPGGPNWAIPAGFDTPAFLEAARANFVALQEAWDKGDLTMLRSMMTDGMLAEIRSQLAEREKQLGGQANRTEVAMLEAQLLGIEDAGQEYMASVEFSGMIREEPSAGPSPFREVWNMTKPKDGATGWLVAGVQALQ